MRTNGDSEDASLDEARAFLDAIHSHGAHARERNGPTERRRETLAALSLHFSSLGITRVGDLTGLDRIGIPVWFASRPNARSLSVAQGKGLCEDDAIISAVGEAIEHALAERPEKMITRISSWREMQSAGLNTASLRKMLRLGGADFDPERERGWVPGLSLRTGCKVFAPYELVGLDLREDAPWDRSAFRMTSIGLAAGNSLSQAALHALLELIENGATASFEMFGMISRLVAPLLHHIGHHELLDEAIAKIRKSGLEPRFVGLATERKLPVIGAFIERPIYGQSRSTGARFCAGFACRLDPSSAALAALLEAVQSRITDISGARDDILPDDYLPSRATFQYPAGYSTALHMYNSCFAATADTTNAINIALDALFTSGAEDAYVFPVASDRLNIRVARVLVPGLEAPATDGVMTLGCRSLRQILAT